MDKKSRRRFMRKFKKLDKKLANDYLKEKKEKEGEILERFFFNF